MDPSTELPFDTSCLPISQVTLSSNCIRPLWTCGHNVHHPCNSAHLLSLVPRENLVWSCSLETKQIGWRQLLSALDHSQLLELVLMWLCLTSSLACELVWSCCVLSSWMRFFQTPKSWPLLFITISSILGKMFSIIPSTRSPWILFVLRVELWCGGLMLGSGPVPPVWVLALGWSQLAA